jgi:hypothetical protein
MCSLIEFCENIHLLTTRPQLFLLIKIKKRICVCLSDAARMYFIMILFNLVKGSFVLLIVQIRGFKELAGNIAE